MIVSRGEGSSLGDNSPTSRFLALQVGGLWRQISPSSLVKYVMVTNPNQKPLSNGRIQRQRLKQRKLTMIYGTWNVQGLSNKLQEAMEAVKSVRGNIVCLTEIKRKGKGCTIMLAGYVLAWSGVDKSERAKAGVAILLRKHLTKSIQDIQYINERCLRIDLRIFGRDITILAVYAPTDDSSAHVKDEFLQTTNIDR